MRALHLLWCDFKSGGQVSSSTCLGPIKHGCAFWNNCEFEAIQWTHDCTVKSTVAPTKPGVT